MRQGEIATKFLNGMMDTLLLQMLNDEPMHGYELRKKIRKEYGVYFGISTVYRLLYDFEASGLIKGEWTNEKKRPRKIYSLTASGQKRLDFNEASLRMLCQHAELVR